MDRIKIIRDKLGRFLEIPRCPYCKYEIYEWRDIPIVEKQKFNCVLCRKDFYLYFVDYQLGDSLNAL